MTARRQSRIPWFAFLIGLVALTGCMPVLAPGGWNYAVYYMAKSEEARVTLEKRVKADPVLEHVGYQKGRWITGALGSYYTGDFITIGCFVKDKDGSGFRAHQRQIETALGPDLMKLLEISTRAFPSP